MSAQSNPPHPKHVGKGIEAGAGVSDPAAHPFTLSHTPEMPELLAALRCSLAVSTYQAGKVIIISSDGERLHQLPRAFDTPMGMAIDGNRLAVATKTKSSFLFIIPRWGRLTRSSRACMIPSSCRAKCFLPARWPCTTWRSMTKASSGEHLLLLPVQD